MITAAREDPSSPAPRHPRLAERLRPHLPAAAVLSALVLFLFRDVVFRGQVFYYRDVHLQWYVQALAFVRSIAAGSWPVWNPWVGFGQPLWANPNNQVLYPFTWLHLVMMPWTYYTCFVVAHFLFSAAGAYALALRLGLSRPAATVAAAVWVASGPFLSLVDLWNHLAAAAWLPWIFLAGDRALAPGRVGAAVVWGAALAMPVFAGSPETALMAGLSVLAYAVGCALPRGGRVPNHGQVARTTLTAFAFAVVLSVAQWWPSLELLLRSPRFSSLGSAGRIFWSVHPLVMLQTVFPVFPDSLPLSGEARAAYSESREAYLRSLYLGVASIGLVATSVEAGRRRRWLFFFALAAAGALLALGRHTPVYGAAAWLLPPLRALRFPAKALVLTGFGWAMLVGLGVDAWRRGGGERLARWGAGGALALAAASAGGLALVLHTKAEDWGSALLFRASSPRSFTDILAPTARSLAVAAAFAAAMLVLVAVRGRIRSRPGRLAGLAGALVIADLLSVHHHLNPTAARELFTFRPAALAVVRPQPFMRTYSYDYFDAGKAPRYLGHRAAYLTSTPQEDWPTVWFDALALRSALFPSVIGSWSLESAYDLDRLDLYSPPLRLLTLALREVEGSALHTRLLRLGAVEYVAALHRQGFEDLAPVAVLPTLFVEPLFVFRVPDPLPRTYAVDAARRADGLVAEVRALAEPSFDPRHEIVVSGGPPATAGTPLFSGRSRIIELRPDRVRLEAEMSAAGFVVLVDAHDPGWRATIDGLPTDVLRANVAFRGVAVPAGRHVIEYLYRPRSITGGLAVSGAALVAGLAVAIADRRRRSRSPREAT